MSSGFHYPIDLNEDQRHQTFFFNTPLASSPHQASPSSTSSLSYLPFFTNSQQEHDGYITSFHGVHHHLPHPLEEKILIPNGGSSCDHMEPKKKTKLKLTIKKKEEKTDFLQNRIKGDSSSSPTTTTTTIKSMSSKMANNKQLIIDQNLVEEEDEHKNCSPDRRRTAYDNGYGNSSNSAIIRVCSDCNTTKTPLWRSGPRGPKSLCNACGIRQRKARRAAMAAAAATSGVDDSPPPPPQITMKKKMLNKKKRSNYGNIKGDHFTLAPSKAKKCKITSADSDSSKSLSSPTSSSTPNKLCFDDLTLILSKSWAFQQVFPQDEREAAILLMALSYGMVHG